MGKIMIMTETIGGNGHFRAAQSLMRGLREVEPDAEVEITCGLPHFSKQLETLTRKVYLNTLQYAPGLWGAAYSKEEEISDTLRDSLGKVLARKLQSFLENSGPRVVVCTHAFCLAALGHLKEREGASFRLGAAITDFDVNGFWVHPAVDFYLVAHPAVTAKLRERYGVPEERIHCTGIPIDPDFSRPRPEKSTLRSRVGWDPDSFTVLLMGGGVGLGPLEECIRHFQLDMPEAQLVVVTGKNRALYRRLQARFSHRENTHIYGFVNRMANMMGAADLIVSKPGGLTSSEALATGLPLLICRPIPGQEERNSRFLVRHRVALRQDQPRAIPGHIHPLMQDPRRWEQMSERARNLGRPRSSLDAAKVVLNHL